MIFLSCVSANLLPSTSMRLSISSGVINERNFYQLAILMPDNGLKDSFGKGLEFTEITYAKNVVNFSGDDKAVHAVYRSCAQSYQFILHFLLSLCIVA